MSQKQFIVNDLRFSIVRGTRKPGEPLREAQLCEEYQTSRTPIREALNQLVKEGLIKLIPNVGAKVVEFSTKNASDIFDVLICLESATARLAATVGVNISILEENLFKMGKAIGNYDSDLIYELNLQFHELIAEATTNTYLLNIRKNFRNLSSRFDRINIIVPGQLDDTLNFHRKIIDALNARNPILAEFLAKEHLESAKKHLLEYLKDSNILNDQNSALLGRNGPISKKER